MLGFFRKYQKYCYVIITIVIIISFSFFGTYSTLQENQYRDDPAFTAIDGSVVKRSELEKLLLFISSDATDKRWYGPRFGPNFLNNGVIRNDFLKTGLAQVLATEYHDQLSEDIQTRFTKEKRFKPYAHPQAKFVNAEEIWNHFIPGLTPTYQALIKQEDPISPKAFDLRVKLYLAEQEFPSPYLRQVLMQQQGQYSWLPPDENLQYQDLALFGYHSTEDWFGPHFTRLIGAFIINSAKIAQQKGYHIPKEEVLADLLQNNQRSFQENSKHPQFSIASASDYLKQQLRMMGIDLNEAIKQWNQVMLFRRLYHDIGNSNLTDALAYDQFHQFSHEAVSGESYQLPSSLQLGQLHNLAQLEFYLRATANKYNPERDLRLPTTFKTVTEVEKKYPELIRNRYLVEIASVDKSKLYSKVGVKEAWGWEVKNWERLQGIFADVDTSDVKTDEERYALLESLPETTRWRIDTHARKAIVGTHPEWLREALEQAPKIKEIWSIPVAGNNVPLKGVQNGTQFRKWLSELKDNEVATYADEGAIYHQIQILEKSSNKEIFTFEEAQMNGILDELLERELLQYYTRVKEASPEKYQAPDGSWKELKEVKEEIERRYFSKVINNVEKQYRKLGPKEKIPTEFTPDFIASVRLYPEVLTIKGKVVAGDLTPFATSSVSTTLEEAKPLHEQWHLVKESFSYDRTQEGNRKELLSLKEGEWSSIFLAPNGEMGFFKASEKGTKIQSDEIVKKVGLLHQLLSNEVQRNYAREVVALLKEKDAISLDYK